jgi:uncharacterized protein YlaN (UPF0358 family)
MIIIWKQKWAYNWIVTFCPIVTCNTWGQSFYKIVHCDFLSYMFCQNAKFKPWLFVLWLFVRDFLSVKPPKSLLESATENITQVICQNITVPNITTETCTKYNNVLYETQMFIWTFNLARIIIIIIHFCNNNNNNKLYVQVI